MSKRKPSERQRWISLILFRIGKDTAWEDDHQRFREIHAITSAFEKVRRVVRLQTNGSALELRARR